MKSVFVFLAIFLVASSSAQSGHLFAKAKSEPKSRCEIIGDKTNPDKVSTEWIDSTNDCIDKLKEQVNKEVDASMTYLGMAMHFSKDAVNRPGFAKFFFDAAAEEREHAIGLIDFLLTRGELHDVFNIINLKDLTVDNIDTTTALQNALNKEIEVTKSIRNIIKECEEADKNCHGKEFNDYYASDHLTGNFLKEQYEGQRHIAGKISTLIKMRKGDHSQLGEFLFDKKLLKGGLFN